MSSAYQRLMVLANEADIPSTEAKVRELNKLLERVYDLRNIPETIGMREKKYASDISREKFAEIEPLLVSVRRRTKPT
ncbi:MAG: hypothetical protein Q8R84_01575, partial [Candidatus Nitrotoga sp.]|nr:hypothetical protein [Candidatus Nitrotoga sp.]